MDLTSIDLNRLSPAQRKKIEAIQEKMKQLESRTQQILTTKTKQVRADETRRAIVLGKRLEAKAQTDKRAKQVIESLLEGMEENFQYLFPEKWPDALRPGPKPKH